MYREINNWIVTKHGFGEIPNEKSKEILIAILGAYSYSIPEEEGFEGAIRYVSNSRCPNLRVAGMDFKEYLEILFEKCPNTEFKVLAFSKGNIIVYFAMKDMEKKIPIIAAGVPALGCSLSSETKILENIKLLPKSVTLAIQRKFIKADLERDLAPESFSMRLFNKQEYSEMVTIQYITKIGKISFDDLIYSIQDVIVFLVSKTQLQDGVLSAEEQKLILPDEKIRIANATHSRAVRTILKDLKERPI